MTQEELEKKIANRYAIIYKEMIQSEPPELEKATVLLETGLDSLGFTILVSALEDELGYDPFQLSDESYYPVTFGEFTEFYFRHLPG